MDPEKLTESLREWVAVSETLAELVPGASLAELIDYANGVVRSPVAATILVAAMKAPPAADEKKAPGYARRR